MEAGIPAMRQGQLRLARLAPVGAKDRRVEPSGLQPIPLGLGFPTTQQKQKAPLGSGAFWIESGVVPESKARGGGV